MKTLLHICCAPCSIACIESLRAEGIEPTGFWYNPNIHPMTEYKMRKNTLVEYAKTIGLRLEIENEYGLRRFIEGIYPDFDHRCGFCYRLRMEETARFAAENGFDSFLTTLLISKYYWQGKAEARHQLLYGYDAGFAQQTFHVLEELTRRLDDLDREVVEAVHDAFAQAL